MKLTSWISTGASVAGSFLVASQVFFLGYAAFIVGSFGWAYVGIVKGDKPLVAMNAIFLAANVLGLYNAF